MRERERERERERDAAAGGDREAFQSPIWMAYRLHQGIHSILSGEKRVTKKLVATDAILGDNS